MKEPKLKEVKCKINPWEWKKTENVFSIYSNQSEDIDFCQVCQEYLENCECEMLCSTCETFTQECRCDNCKCESCYKRDNPVKFTIQDVLDRLPPNVSPKDVIMAPGYEYNGSQAYVNFYYYPNIVADPEGYAKDLALFKAANDEYQKEMVVYKKWQDEQEKVKKIKHLEEKLKKLKGE